MCKPNYRQAQQGRGVRVKVLTRVGPYPGQIWYMDPRWRVLHPNEERPHTTETIRDHDCNDLGLNIIGQAVYRLLLHPIIMYCSSYISPICCLKELQVLIVETWLLLKTFSMEFWGFSLTEVFHSTVNLLILSWNLTSLLHAMLAN